MEIVKTRSKKYNLFFKGKKLNRRQLTKRDLKDLFGGYYGGDNEMITDEMMDPSKVTYVDQSDSAFDATDAGFNVLKNIPEAGALLNKIYSGVKPIAQFITSLVPDKRLPSVQFYSKTGISPADLVFNRPFDYLLDLDTGQPTFDQYSMDIQNKYISFQRYWFRKVTSTNQYNSLAHKGNYVSVPPYFQMADVLYSPLSQSDLYAVTQMFQTKNQQAGDLFNILVKIGDDQYNELEIPVTSPDGMFLNSKGQVMKG